MFTRICLTFLATKSEPIPTILSSSILYNCLPCRSCTSTSKLPTKIIEKSIPSLFPKSQGLEWNILEKSFKKFYEVCEAENIETIDSVNTKDDGVYGKEISEIFCLNPTFEKHFQKIYDVLKIHAENLNQTAIVGKQDNLCELVEYLFSVLKINGSELITMLHSHPELLKLNVWDLIEKVEIFRRYGVGGQQLQTIIKKCSKLLLVNKEKLNNAEYFVANDLQFTRQEIPKLLSKSPNIFIDPLDMTEEKLHFILKEMSGAKTYKEMSQHGILNFSLNFLKLRHAFLKRRGLYQQPDKNGYTQFANPPLKEIYCNTDAKFCTDIALCHIDELVIFKKIFELESELLVCEAAEEEIEEVEETSTSKNTFADDLLQYL